MERPLYSSKSNVTQEVFHLPALFMGWGVVTEISKCRKKKLEVSGMYFAVGATIGVHQVMTSIGSKQKLIENSFDICTIKVHIWHLCISI